MKTKITVIKINNINVIFIVTQNFKIIDIGHLFNESFFFLVTKNKYIIINSYDIKINK